MIEVVVNTGTLARSRRGSITGEIFLRHATEAFPDSRWSDFPVVVLSWWIEGIRKVVAGQDDSYVGHFMDGPYAFVVKRRARNAASIAWGRRDEEEFVEEVDFYALRRSAVVAGQHVVAACHARGWSSDDLDSLEQAIARGAA